MMSHNARRNYDRYVALAQAELQAGDRVAAENYYQHAAFADTEIPRSSPVSGDGDHVLMNERPPFRGISRDLIPYALETDWPLGHVGLELRNVGKN
jgi:hypothetical protein